MLPRRVGACRREPNRSTARAVSSSNLDARDNEPEHLARLSTMPNPVLSSLAMSVGIACLVCCTPAAVVGAQSAAVVPSVEYTHAQRLVAIDGTRHLNVFCLGTGSPTVLMDAGAGETMMVWRHVQRQIASLTRTCSYDRAGYAFSDPADRPSDALNAVDDLHRLVHTVIRGPVVYVGHSIAGLYGALFEAMYPQDIAGAVLIDPAVADQYRHTSATHTPSELKQSSEGFARARAAIRKCVDLARAGALSHATTKDALGCVDTRGYADSVDDVLRRELERQYALPKTWAASLSEYGSMWPRPGQTTSIDDAEMDGRDITFGDKPLIVLTRSKAQPVPGITPAHSRDSEAAWRAGHVALANTSTHGVDIVVAGAGHHIQFDQPAAVVGAVRRVIDEVRR